ncbi:hypothetical protein IH970_11220, partial [candidate division KSB1 bacterium]|nr:hypothetical protein [candidate division KSB1 bacterium]
MNYAIQTAAEVEIRIYNLLRERVRTLVNENKKVGKYSVAWDGKNDFGKRVASGNYYYQLKVGEDSQGNDQYADMRPFAPLAIPLLLAEVARSLLGEKTRLEGSDYIEAFAGIRRLTGTAIGGMLDLDRMKTADQFTDWAQRFAGDLFGMASTPFRTFKDLATLYDDEEDIILDEDVKINTPLGPSKFFNSFLANLPGVGKAVLPPVPSPTREGFFGQEEDLIEGVPNPVLRQLTGLSIQTRTPLEKELERLNIQPRTRTGVKVLDRLTDSFMGVAISRSPVDKFVQGDDYFTLDDFGRKTLLRDHMTEVRAAAKAVAMREGGDEIVEEIVTAALRMGPEKWEEYLSKLQIPQAWRDAILQ